VLLVVSSERAKGKPPCASSHFFSLFFLFKKKLQRFHLTHRELSVDHVPLSTGQIKFQTLGDQLSANHLETLKNVRFQI